jgi:hypothetical protein
LIQEDYILRIYRDRQNHRMVLGTVERVDGKRTSRLPRFTVFMDFEELRWILGIARGQTPRLEQITDQAPYGFPSCE